MSYNRLLQKQINKYLSPDLLENPFLKEFIKSINHSYVAFERDKDLMDHAFEQSESEYYKINASLKQEFELKKQSIANLYEGLVGIDDDSEIKDEEKNDLLFISKYLNKQINKRKEIENTLSQTVELLKSLLANIQSGIKVEDENRKILFINQLYCDMFTIPTTPEQMIAQDCSKLTVEYKDLFVSSDEFCERVETIIADRKLVTNELLETVDNRFLERDYIPIFIDGEYKGNLWKYTDVTQRVNTNNLLEQGEERNRLIMNSALNAIVTIDKNGLITFWNDRAEKIFGWKREEVFGKKLNDTIFSEGNKTTNEIEITKFIKSGEELVLNKQIEITGINKKGEEFPIEISVIPVKQGTNVFFCAFIQDISLRKKAESNLKFQEEKYRNIIANMNLGLIEVDNNDIIQYANQSFSSISGFDLSELIGRNPSELFVFGENFEVMQSKKEVRRKGISDIYQIPVKNKRGELRWWAISGAPNFDDNGNLVGSIGIHLDVTDQKQLEIELENEKTRAEEASRAKEAFLANMSHEIRTPLNAIIGFLRELEKQELSDLQKRYVENSSFASKHLLAIINNILDISKIEAREMSLEQEDFILESTLNNVLTVLEPKAKQKGIKLEATISKDTFPVLKGDALRIDQILFNLIGNSLKFTNTGYISIKTNVINEDEKSQELCISIEDTGIGMDKSYINTIFKKFSQEDKAVTRKFGGTGLGMAITKELVQLMNGRIEVESEKNKGTTIFIYIRLLKGDVQNINTLKNQETEYNSIDLNGISVLLVEDNEMNRMVAQNSLQYFNCNVVEAVNGLEALECLKDNHFDVILMDIQMPEMDGIEATKIIRNKLKLTTPIIALTANAFKTEIEKCKKAGMNDYVTKPFDEAILIETIAKQTIKKTIIIAKENTIMDNQKIYNLNSLNALSRGNDDFVIKMISIFIDQTKDTIIKVEEALNGNDFIEVSKLIHKIKPSVDGLGILSISNEIKLLEKIAKETSDKDQMVALFDVIKEVLSKVVVLLEQNELK
ncbi:PAS domain S-box protein [Flavobacterium sp. SUN046]|uniref:PAS domain-containing hybrid sensor histidine kinase/response regulator n=1 Tax=Flavobacterium sp. SUN046 TaxID=3002440 RepID=UPI002DBE2241|nr:PAS domain S-box protein [Flavobacterium sp. SUN046]MEC4049263.1 PAS domain S-box protein [Flavobacterium sp. SUN046]